MIDFKEARQKARIVYDLYKKTYPNTYDFNGSCREAEKFRANFFKIFERDIIFDVGDIVIGWHNDHSSSSLHRNPWKIKSFRLHREENQVLVVPVNAPGDCTVKRLKFYKEDD